jgi:hypothetical protein
LFLLAGAYLLAPAGWCLELCALGLPSCLSLKPCASRRVSQFQVKPGQKLVLKIAAARIIKVVLLLLLCGTGTCTNFSSTRLAHKYIPQNKIKRSSVHQSLIGKSAMNSAKLKRLNTLKI